MSKEDPTPEPPAVTVEDDTETAAYRGLGKMKVDTTDDGWGQGVFGDQEDTTQPPPPDRERDSTEVELRKIRRSPRPAGVDDDPEEEVSLLLPAVVAGLGVLLAGGLLIWVFA